jgi:hypothetical protein
MAHLAAKSYGNCVTKLLMTLVHWHKGPLHMWPTCKCNFLEGQLKVGKAKLTGHTTVLFVNIFFQYHHFAS